jgi:hypothetical protein
MTRSSRAEVRQIIRAACARVNAPAGIMKTTILLAGLLAGAPLADDPPPLAALLDTAGRYVRGFENDFAAVVSDETYQQQDRTTRRMLGIDRTATATRALRSELAFLWLADAHEWLSVRSVLSVDRQPVADSHARLERMLADRAPNAAGRFRGLRDESARFNIGAIRRNAGPLPVFDARHLRPGRQTRRMGAGPDGGDLYAATRRYRRNHVPGHLLELSPLRNVGANSAARVAPQFV